MSLTNLNRVLISDACDPDCAKILQQHGVNVDYKPKLPLPELLAEIKNYDGLIVRSATKVTKQVIDAATNLKIIGRAGTGVDNIDADAATERGIIVMNTPGGNTLSAAEHTCAMMLAASRLIPQGYASMQTGKWERSQFMGNEVFGKTLAIIGLGRIGREVALRMQSFGMNTIGYDPIIPPEASKDFGVIGLTLEEIWPLADYITVHVPLIPQTENLINDSVLKKCKKGVFIINVARGGIVDEAALLRSLESGHCGGAALDVFTKEPPSDFNLVKHPKIVTTPHLGANTVEAQSRVAQEIAQQFIEYAEGKPPVGVVNAPLLCESLVPGRSPWIALAQSLGNLASSLVLKGNGKQQCDVTLTTYNKDLEKYAHLLVNSAVIGALRTNQSNANFINVKHFMEKYSIKVKTAHEDQATKSHLISIQVKSDKLAHTSVGTVIGNSSFLVSVDGQGFKTPVVLNENFDFFRVNEKSTTKVLDYFEKKGLQVQAFNQTDRSGDFNYLAVNFAKRTENIKEGGGDMLNYIATV